MRRPGRAASIGALDNLRGITINENSLPSPADQRYLARRRLHGQKDQLARPVRESSARRLRDAQSECERVIGHPTSLPDKQYSAKTDVSRHSEEIARGGPSEVPIYPAQPCTTACSMRGKQDADTVVSRRLSRFRTRSMTVQTRWSSNSSRRSKRATDGPPFTGGSA